MQLKEAIRLEWYTVAWMVVAAAVGLGLGAVSRSVSLTAFGLDSAVELICAGILLRRLGIELVNGREHSEGPERRAAAGVGLMLLLAALYITVDAIAHLIRHQSAEVSAAGMILTLITIPIVAPLAHRKLRIAREIESRALRADAIGNVVCWYLAAVVLTSLIGQHYLRLWWLDGVASLIVVGLLVVEGFQAMRGGKVGAAGTNGRTHTDRRE